MKYYLLTFMAFLGVATLSAQTTITGTVYDNSNEPLTGAYIELKGTEDGTVTDLDGKFSLTVNEVPPFTLVISFVGYDDTEYNVTGNTTNLRIVLSSASSFLNEVVISASRVEERILESPVTIEKLNLRAIKSSGAIDYFDQMTKLKGVTGASGSLTFNAINTRGFAGIANTRFVQLVDGIDNSAPLLNFPMGNLIGIGESDIENVELVPGAASALYGPNAFNGIMLMNSKNPFDYQGITASVKTGFTSASNDATNPMYGLDLRFAQAWGKFAMKITGSYFGATDWKANDYYTDMATKHVYSDAPRLNPDGTIHVGDKPLQFDGINLYGDEGILSTVPLGALPDGHPTRGALTDAVAAGIAAATGADIEFLKGFIGSNFQFLPTVQLRRTGISEEALLDNRNATSAKGAIALHYRPVSDIDINYNFRIGSGDAIYQGSEKYVLRDFVSYSNKIEATGKNFMVRSYMTQTDAGNSYNMTALGSYTNELLAGTASAWAPAYLGSVVGTYMGTALQHIMGGGTTPISDLFASQDLYNQANVKARIDADNILPSRDDPNFQKAIETIRGTLFQHSDPANGILGGASFIDNSRLWHTEGTYDFTSLTDDKLGILVGANYRLYDLFTEGTVFNEDPEGTGTNSRIRNNEFGGFVQLTKKMIEERLRVSASLRYDKNENFAGILSPRVAVVGTMGEKRQHNIRASFQTGFRNPDTQAQFIYFPASTILMGGAKVNAERYGVYEGGAYTAASWAAFQQSALQGAPDPSLLQEIYMDYIKPEQLSSFELGYRSVIGNLFIDWNTYMTFYKDFITATNVVAKEGFMHQGQLVNGVAEGDPLILRPYHNVSDRVTSWGMGLGLSYNLGKGYLVNANYSYMDFDSGDTDKKAIDFNSPKNILNIGASNNDIARSNFGASINYRWQDQFYWVSSFGYGDIDSYGTLDASISYNFKSLGTSIKVGGTNLVGPDYITNIGGPMIGKTFFVGITYDAGF